jgi:hypothetical protein
LRSRANDLCGRRDVTKLLDVLKYVREHLSFLRQEIPDTNQITWFIVCCLTSQPHVVARSGESRKGLILPSIGNFVVTMETLVIVLLPGTASDCQTGDIAP